MILDSSLQRSVLGLNKIIHTSLYYVRVPNRYWDDTDWSSSLCEGDVCRDEDLHWTAWRWQRRISLIKTKVVCTLKHNNKN